MGAGTLAPDLRRPAGSARPRIREVSRPVAILSGLTVLGALLRFTRLGHQGFWFDEAHSTLLVHSSLGGMLGLIPQIESTPPLYYCLAWAWAHVFGSGEVGLRSLSALAGVATVPVAYAVGARLISRRVGLILAALTAGSPFLIWYSQEARSYSLLVLLAALSLWAFALSREDPTPKRVGAWVLASALALATHYYALLTVVPEALWLLAIHRDRRSVRFGLAAVGACGLALIPLAISQAGTGHASWIAPVALDLRLGQIAPQFLIGTGAPAAGGLKLAGAGAIALALVLLIRRADRAERRGALWAGGLAASGLGLNLVLVAGGVDDLITRNVIVLWLPLALAVAAGLGVRRAGLAGLAGTAVLCSIGIIAAVGVSVDRNLQRPDWRPVARAIGPRAGAGAPAGRAILMERYKRTLPLSLYLPGIRFLPRGGATVNELDVIAIRAPHDAFCWWGAACNLFPSRLPSTYALPGFRASGPPVRVGQFTLQRLRSDAPVRITPAMVAQAVPTATLRRDGLLIQPPA